MAPGLNLDCFCWLYLLPLLSGRYYLQKNARAAHPSPKTAQRRSPKRSCVAARRACSRAMTAWMTVCRTIVLLSVGSKQNFDFFRFPGLLLFSLHFILSSYFIIWRLRECRKFLVLLSAGSEQDFDFSFVFLGCCCLHCILFCLLILLFKGVDIAAIL